MAVVSIQYLRAVAAMMVVVYHLELQLARLGYEGYWPHWLSAGVDIFFVISGAIMWLTTDGRQATPWRFFAKRILRIVPLYWLLTGVMVAVMAVSPASLQNARFDLAHVAASYLFLPWPHPVTGLMEPVLVPGWTLNYEMFFYLLFGLALILPSVPRLVAAAAALLALVGLQLLDPAPASALGFYSSSIMLEFACGMALGWAYGRGAALPAWAGMICIVAGFAGLAAEPALGDVPRLLGRGLPALLIVAGALSVERRRGLPHLPAAHLLGDASYSLYLSHTIVLAVLGKAALAAGLGSLPGGLVLFAVAAPGLAGLGGVLLYRLVERPLLLWLTPRTVRPAAAPTAP